MKTKYLYVLVQTENVPSKPGTCNFHLLGILLRLRKLVSVTGKFLLEHTKTKFSDNMEEGLSDRNSSSINESCGMIHIDLRIFWLPAHYLLSSHSAARH